MRGCRGGGQINEEIARGSEGARPVWICGKDEMVWTGYMIPVKRCGNGEIDAIVNMW